MTSSGRGVTVPTYVVISVGPVWVTFEAECDLQLQHRTRGFLLQYRGLRSQSPVSRTTPAAFLPGRGLTSIIPGPTKTFREKRELLMIWNFERLKDKETPHISIPNFFLRPTSAEKTLHPPASGCPVAECLEREGSPARPWRAGTPPGAP